ncbi:uncharacterized protein LOC141899810 [Tubulanus polymorphus]|uniref:uncharacterized protein LOC141899810 n=1 Tax=Tubulanus polymorphus TaxID=672921 RepID=UPI003DA578C4
MTRDKADVNSIIAQRDYMDTISRSFASRVEKRRNLVICSCRFHRFAEEFSFRLDDLLELLCSDINADDVEAAEKALQELQDKCDAIDYAAHKTIEEGHILLDLLSLPIKNALGKDVTPNYEDAKEHIQKLLDDLQDRKARCDELSDVRRLKLQQILQLRTCEQDAKQAIDWILELCVVMVQQHTEMGRNPAEAENLQEEHKKFEETARGTYDYGKQLLQAGLVLRRSLRYNVAPNNELAQQLANAWKKFSNGVSERSSRLSVSHVFHKNSDEVLEQIDEVTLAVSQVINQEMGPEELQTVYLNKKEKTLDDYSEVSKMGQALLDRLALPILVDDGMESDLHFNDQDSSSAIKDKLDLLEHRMTDLQEHWNNQTSQNSAMMEYTRKKYGNSRNRKSTPKSKSMKEYNNSKQNNDVVPEAVRLTEVQLQMVPKTTAVNEFSNGGFDDDLDGWHAPNDWEQFEKDMKESHDWIRIRIQTMEPDLMEVGSSLDEALQLRKELDEICMKLSLKQRQITELLARADTLVAEQRTPTEVYEAMAQSLGEAWKDLTNQLDYRRVLLDQSIAFHQSAKDFAGKMEHAQGRFGSMSLAQDVESARRLLQQHQEMKKSILESSKLTLEQGQALLARIKEMGMHADIQNYHATTAACYGIEHMLELLHDRRRHLEDMWLQRKIKLEQCLQLCQLDQEVHKISEWYTNQGDVYLSNRNLGDSMSAIQHLQDQHTRFESQAREVQETVLRLIRTANQILHSTSLDADEIKERLRMIDERSENFMIQLDTRRRNLSLAGSFFKQAHAAILKLDQIEMQLNSTDLPRNSAMLAERHASLSNAIIEVTTPALREGRILLERVSSDDSGADGVRVKMDELVARSTALEDLCKARKEQVGEKSQAYNMFQEKYTSVHTWIVQVGLAILNDHRELGQNLYTAQDFLELHERLDEEIMDKDKDVESLWNAAQDLLTAEDPDAADADEKAKNLRENWTILKSIVEIRIQLTLVYTVFLRLNQQLTQELDEIEELLKSNRYYLQDISEAVIKHIESKWTQMFQTYQELSDKGQEFLDRNKEVDAEANKLDNRRTVFIVESYLTKFKDRKEHITNLLEVWQQHVMSGKEFKSQWHQFVQDARRTIDWIMTVEHEFFPVIAGELGSTTQTCDHFRERLAEFEPMSKKAQEEVDEHLKTAEMLALKGDTKGQKDQIVNELLKVHQRFQARIGEYKTLLTMTIAFFKNLEQLDMLIERTEKEYQENELPQEVIKAEQSLLHHMNSKESMDKILNYTFNEGEEIVVRVRQQGSEEIATQEVQTMLELADDRRRQWSKSWEEQKERLEQNYQICQFNYDLRQIHYEIDDLNRQLQNKKGNLGTSLPGVRMTSEAFKQFELTIEVIEKKLQNFISTAELMLKDKHYDSKHIRSEIEKLENKWSTFHTSVHDYRNQLEVSIIFFQLLDEADDWLKDGSQLLMNIGRKSMDCRTADDADELINQINVHVQEGQKQQEERPQAQQRVRHVVVKYHDLVSQFNQANLELVGLRDNLKKLEEQPPMVEEIPQVAVAPVHAEPEPMVVEKSPSPVRKSPSPMKKSPSPIPVEEEEVTKQVKDEVQATIELPAVQPPRVIQPLKSAEVMEGIRLTFECRFDAGGEEPEITWFKENIALISPDYEKFYQNGLATLTIEETFSEDTAMYTCKCQNSAGAVETSARLTVRAASAPKLQEPLIDITAPEGKPITIDCRFTANPQPEVTWLRGTEPIIPSSVFKIVIETNFTSLEISEAYPEDSGVYTVILKNVAGEARDTCTITIESTYPGEQDVASDAEPSQPMFVQHLLDREVMEGGRVRLDCVIVGQPEPEVIWYKQQKPVKESQDFQLLFEGDRCTLIIREAYLEDSGEYKCIARNPYGTAESACRLHVEPLSELSDAASIQSLTAEMTAPRFTMLMSDTLVKEGDRVQLTCRVTGQPEPSVSWYREEILIENSPDYQITADGEIQTLTIPEVFAEDAGTFMVRAINPAGEAKCYAKLMVEAASPEDLSRKPVKTMTFVPREEPQRFAPSPVRVSLTREVSHYPPEFKELFRDQTVPLGDPVRFACVIYGNPKPKVTWYFNGEEITNKDYVVDMEGDRHSLFIPEIFEEDAGRFSCSAENLSGKATCSALLMIGEPPRPQPPTPEG